MITDGPPGAAVFSPVPVPRLIVYSSDYLPFDALYDLAFTLCELDMMGIWRRYRHGVVETGRDVHYELRQMLACTRESLDYASGEYSVKAE